MKKVTELKSRQKSVIIDEDLPKPLIFACSECGNHLESNQKICEKCGKQQ